MFFLHKKMKILSCFILISLSSHIVTAQNSLITDRPDQTESPNAVAIGVIQIESGFQFQRSDLSKTKSEEQIAHPSNLIRYGIANRLELRLVTEYMSNTVYDKKSNEKKIQNTGMENIEFGFKYQFSQDQSRTILGFMAHLDIPIKNKKTNYQQYGLVSRLNISHQLSEKQCVGANIGYNNFSYIVNGSEVFSKNVGDLTYTLVYGQAISNRVGVYIETFGEYINFKTWEQNVDLGMTYLINDNLQLDYSFGLGINQVMNYHSLGVSFRLNN